MAGIAEVPAKVSGPVVNRVSSTAPPRRNDARARGHSHLLLDHPQHAARGAPSAMRMPISCDRRVTLYAITPWIPWAWSQLRWGRRS